MNNVTPTQHPAARSKRQLAMLNRNTAGQMLRIDAFLKFILSLMIELIMTALTSTANAADRQYYSFEFDLRKDNQHAVILDYWYGNSKLDSWINEPEELIKKGHTFCCQAVAQPMPPGGLLYVKWRDTETQKVYEDTVDLRHRLPKKIEDHTIYLMLKGAQLYVYLISPEGNKRPPNETYIGPRMFRDLKIVTLYPDQAK
jgi:hypothetical protein